MPCIPFYLALIAAHKQIKRLNSQQHESKSHSEVIRLEVDKWRHLAETTQSQLKDLESSFSDKEKLLIERANRSEAEVLEAKTKALTLESEITRTLEEHKKAIDDAQQKER
jgi:predicted CopG family antitoxin